MKGGPLADLLFCMKFPNSKRGGNMAYQSLVDLSNYRS